MKKIRHISTKAHRTGHRGKNKRTRSAARGGEKAVHLLSKPTEMEQLSCSAWTRKNRVVLRGTTLLQLDTQKTGKLCESLFVNH